MITPEAIANLSPLQGLIYLLIMVVPTFMTYWYGRHNKIVANAVTPNHGSSIADSITRIETALAAHGAASSELRTEVGILTDFITEIDAKLNTHIATDLVTEYIDTETWTAENLQPVGFSPITVKENRSHK